MNDTRGWVPVDCFAHRLVLVRRELGLNVKEAAARCGLNYATWSTWENRRIPANLAATVEAISAGLGVDRDWLMWGDQAVERPAGPMPAASLPGEAARSVAA